MIHTATTPLILLLVFLPDAALDTFLRFFTRPYVSFYLYTHKLSKFFHRPLYVILANLSHPQWLAEMILATNLALLGLFLHTGVSAATLSHIMPTSFWCCWLLFHGISHLAALFWGSRRSRFFCAIFEPWVYGTLFFAFVIYSPSPRLAAACLGTSFAVSLIIPFTLREKNGPA